MHVVSNSSLAPLSDDVSSEMTTVNLAIPSIELRVEKILTRGHGKIIKMEFKRIKGGFKPVYQFQSLFKDAFLIFVFTVVQYSEKNFNNYFKQSSHTLIVARKPNYETIKISSAP